MSFGVVRWQEATWTCRRPRESTSGFQKMDPVFDGDAVNGLHIRSSGHCKLLRATREKRLESRRACLNEHPAGNITGILEGMNRFSRDECKATGSQAMPLIVVEDASVPPGPRIVHPRWGGGAAVRHRVERSRSTMQTFLLLRTDQMKGYFFAKGMQRVTLARNKADVTRLCSHDQ